MFVAFGGWDAYGAKSFGDTTYRVNRFHLRMEELGIDPDGTSDNLDGLLRLVLRERGVGPRRRGDGSCVPRKAAASLRQSKTAVIAAWTVRASGHVHRGRAPPGLAAARWR